MSSLRPDPPATEGAGAQRRFDWPERFRLDDEGDAIQGQMFDASKYGISRGPRAPRPRPPSEVVAVVTDARWRLVSSKTPGILHRANDSTTLTMSVCGLAGVPMTFDDGQPAAGCPDCAAGQQREGST